MNAYERILNACCGDVEQAELIAQQVARVHAQQAGSVRSRPEPASNSPAEFNPIELLRHPRMLEPS